MKRWQRQFIENFIWGTGISAFWFYFGYKFTGCFWKATVITNCVTFFIGRWIFR